MTSALLARESGVEILYGGREGALEHSLTQNAPVTFVPLPGRPVSSSAGALRAVTSLLAGLPSAWKLIRRHRPDVLIATGGYVSTALGLAQEIARRPVLLLEGNAVPGKTVRLLARGASVVCTAFEAAGRHLPPGKSIVTGFPVRESFSRQIEPAAARESFGLRPEAFTLLVVGGSQGAKFLNDSVADIADELLDSGVQILHQMGPKNDRQGAGDVRGWVTTGTIEDMPSAFAAADVVLCRAGASTLSEMAVSGAAAILVPYPFAADDHQQANAAELEREGRAVLCRQKTTSPGDLMKTISDLKDNSAKRQSLREALRAWGRPRSADEVAGIALQAAAGQFRASRHAAERNRES